MPCEAHRLRLTRNAISGGRDELAYIAWGHTGRGVKSGILVALGGTELSCRRPTLGPERSQHYRGGREANCSTDYYSFSSSNRASLVEKHIYSAVGSQLGQAYARRGAASASSGNTCGGEWWVHQVSALYNNLNTAENLPMQRHNTDTYTTPEVNPIVIYSITSS